MARVPTFRETTEKTIAIHVLTWKKGSKTEKQWRSIFTKYVYPKIGSKPVDKITAAELLASLAPLSIEKAETAKKLRQRLSMVCKWCVTQGHMEQNPGDTLDAAPSPQRQGDRVSPGSPSRRGRTGAHEGPGVERVACLEAALRVLGLDGLSLQRGPGSAMVRD